MSQTSEDGFLEGTFELVRVWPIRITLRQSPLWTFWQGRDTANHLLALNGQVVLCRTSELLLRITRDAASDGGVRDASAVLVEALRTGPTSRIERAARRFDIDMALRATDDLRGCTDEDCECVLGSLDLVHDWASTIGPSFGAWPTALIAAADVLADRVLFGELDNDSATVRLRALEVSNHLRTAVRRAVALSCIVES